MAVALAAWEAPVVVGAGVFSSCGSLSFSECGYNSLSSSSLLLSLIYGALVIRLTGGKMELPSTLGAEWASSLGLMLGMLQFEL